MVELSQLGQAMQASWASRTQGAERPSAQASRPRAGEARPPVLTTSYEGTLPSFGRGTIGSVSQKLPSNWDELKEHLDPKMSATYRWLGDRIGSLHEEQVPVIMDLRTASAGENYERMDEILDEAQAAGKLPQILKTFLMLSVTSGRLAEVYKDENGLELATWLRDNMITPLKEAGLSAAEAKEKLEQVFLKLTFTAHPTEGTQAGYDALIDKMIASVVSLKEQYEAQSSYGEMKDFLRGAVTRGDQDDLVDALREMDAAPAYIEDQIEPVDEQKRFLGSLDAVWDMIPNLLLVAEEVFAREYGEPIDLSQMLRIGTWVACDIDGNPRVTMTQHLESLVEARLKVMKKYEADLEDLERSLANYYYQQRIADKKAEAGRPPIPEDSPYEDCYGTAHANPYLAIVQEKILKPLQASISRLEVAQQSIESYHRPGSKATSSSLLPVYSGLRELELDLENVLAAPLRYIYEDAQRPGDFEMRKINLLLKKAQVFDKTGAQGQTRQGKNILNLLVNLWGLNRTEPAGESLSGRKYDEHILRGIEPEEVSCGERTFKGLEEPCAAVSHLAGDLAAEGDPDNPHTVIFRHGTRVDSKVIAKLRQSLGMHAAIGFGGIKRQIISMNEGFDDMRNVLAIARKEGLFTPGQPSTTELGPPNGKQPESKLEIVPLTEMVKDLDNSYRTTIDALCSSAWRQYLIAQKGRFIVMRGPSDSGKLNGFIPSQWAMFKSKHLDGIVVRIFNAYRKAVTDASDPKSIEELGAWRELAKELGDKHPEKKVIKEALEAFDSSGLIEDLAGGERFYWQDADFEGVRMVNFDGWGEPIARGGGEIFDRTLSDTKSLASSTDDERTVQGSLAYSFRGPKAEHKLRDYVKGAVDTLPERVEFDRAYEKDPKEAIKRHLLVDTGFYSLMEGAGGKLGFAGTLRKSLREEAFGIKMDESLPLDQLIDSPEQEAKFRQYFFHVLSSPLIFLSVVNIASRPVDRSGAKLLASLEAYNFNFVEMARTMPIEDALAFLNDIRAIPYAAMFSLLGGNHIPFFGFSHVLKNKPMMRKIEELYNSRANDSETRFVRHLVDTLKTFIGQTDPDCYFECHQAILDGCLTEAQRDKDYDESSGDGPELVKFIQGLKNDDLSNQIENENRAARRFIAEVTRAPMGDKSDPSLVEIFHDDLAQAALSEAESRDARVSRYALAHVIENILGTVAQEGKNPLTELAPQQLARLRMATVGAGLANGGGGIDN